MPGRRCFVNRSEYSKTARHWLLCFCGVSVHRGRFIHSAQHSMHECNWKVKVWLITAGCLCSFKIAWYRQQHLSAALVLLRDDALKEQFVRGVREQSVRQELRRIAYNSRDKSFHHTRDEALRVLEENDERHHTFRVRVAEIGEEGFLEEQVPVHLRGQDMDSPMQMMQAHQQLQSHVLQLSSQQNEMTHQLRAVLDTFPQGHVARPISVPANMPGHRDGLFPL